MESSSAVGQVGPKGTRVWLRCGEDFAGTAGPACATDAHAGAGDPGADRSSAEGEAGSETCASCARCRSDPAGSIAGSGRCVREAESDVLG